MPPLVEDAGKPVYSGWLAQLHAITERTRGTRWVGGRRTRWFLCGDAVTFWHRPADPKADRISYAVTLDATEQPNGGRRWWWLCPACGKRVELLYLPPGRDRLACRTCHGLRYRSQYATTRKVRRRNRRPWLVADRIGRHWVWLGPWRRR